MKKQAFVIKCIGKSADTEKENTVLKKLFRYILILILATMIVTVTINLIVCLSMKSNVCSLEQSLDDKAYDCIIVLGCGVWGETPTPLLSDRLDAAVALYKSGIATKILMSGDHGRTNYNEVSVMRKYAMDRGVPSEDIFMDHAGFSTYETMYRAADVFGVNRAVIVTQKYHLYRALYDASLLGIEAKGTAATGHVYASQILLDIREAAARMKDFVWCAFKPEPTFRGEKIDIHSSGEVTLD